MLLGQQPPRGRQLAHPGATHLRFQRRGVELPVRFQLLRHTDCAELPSEPLVERRSRSLPVRRQGLDIFLADISILYPYLSLHGQSLLPEVPMTGTANQTTVPASHMWLQQRPRPARAIRAA